MTAQKRKPRQSRNITLHKEQADALNEFQDILRTRFGYRLTLHQTVSWLLAHGRDSARMPISPIEFSVYPAEPIKIGRPRSTKRKAQVRDRIRRKLIR